MKKLYILVVICLLTMIGAQDILAQNLVDVTFRANAAAWRDTLGADGLVQIRGQIAGVAPPSELSEGVTIDWSGNTTMYLSHVEGDYWEGTFAIPEGTVLVYKFFVNARHSTVTPDDEWHHDDWEFNISDGVGDDGVTAGTNRKLDLTNVEADTVLPLQFVNGIGHGNMAQYQTLWEDVDGTFAVWIRVNVAGWEEWNPDNHVIAVRGSNREDWGPTGQLSWGESHPLNREGTSRFYSNVVNVPDEYAAANLRFKFVAHFAGRPLDEDWSEMAYNTNVDIDVETSGADTTIHWKWFDNLKPIAADHDDELIVTFRADMTQAISERGFSHGDTLEVRAGFAGTAEEVRTARMVRVGFTNIYTATDTVTGTLNADLAYQYYMWKDGNDLREIYFDFTFPDKGDPTAERRRVNVTSSTFMVEDNSTDIADPRRRPRFRNTSRLARDVTVTYIVDVRPAIYQVMAGSTLEDIQGNLDVSHPDSILAWGVAMNGPATGGWGSWGLGLMADDTRAMTYQGDSTFALTISYTTDDFVGQEFKFGIGGGDNEGGFGNNHIENIDDTEGTYVLYSQFGSIDPIFYNAWDFENQVPVQTGIPIVEPPDVNLMQLFPLVFNMDTDIVDWNNYTFFPFAGSELMRINNPDKSGLNETNYVLKYTKPQGSDAWAGFFYHLETPINLTDESVFKLNVWSPRADIEAIMKLEVQGGPATGDLKADVTAAGEWVELVWDLSGQNRQTNWDRIVVIMDLDVHPVPSTETWFLDDFRLEGMSPVSVKQIDAGIPERFELSQNYPNPFNPSTTIRFALPKASNVQLEIYNVMGQRVNVLIGNEMYDAGYYSVEWNGLDEKNLPVASGMYVYRIKAGEFTEIKRMIFLK